ncbi:MAG TPA: sugar phosphate isomerase/epimerase [Candidatus Dormibacteraeota bacterium]|nr:sugar phosphate isomerase/epimerase [Candidatus Dormibacteraeota bacterium]
MERRQFLQIGALGALAFTRGPALLADDKSQKFKIGMAATTWLSAAPSMATYWRAAEAIASLGIGATEADNSKTQFEVVFGKKPAEFLERSRRTGVHLMGVYQALFLHDVAKREEMRSKIRSLARFLKTVNAKYIALGWDAPEGVAGQPYQRTPKDVQQAILTANELGRISLEEFDLPIAFHAERDIPGPMILRVLDETDPKYVRLCADVGHLTAAGLDALQTVKKYSSRLSASHWKDFDPKLPGPDYLGKTATGDFVELGKGVVDFPSIAKFYRDIGFGGWVMLELDQTRELSILDSARKMKAYVTDQLKLQFYPRAS